MVETNTEDWPFLVDSVSAELRARGLGIQRVLHPIVGVERDADGAIEAVLHPREASRRESVMHFDLERRLKDEQLAELEEALRKVLADVRATVKDFPAMADRARRMVQLAGAGAARYTDEEVDETVAFLEWLLHDNFIFLGYREYRIREGMISVVPDSGLGILSHTEKSTYAKPVPIESLPPGVRERAVEGDLLIVSKTNRLARVHRRVRMDYIGVRRISAEGEIVGEARMLGLFTTKAYAEPAAQTPLLHRKLRQILRSEDLIEGSHDYKAAVSLFDAFPKDELFAASTHDLRGAVVALLALQGEQVRLLGRRDRDGRSASLIVALPRSRYNPELLARLQDLLHERFETGAVDPHMVLGEGDRVQVHFRVHASEGLPDVDFRELEREVVRRRAPGTTSCGMPWSLATARCRAACWRPSGACASRATTRPRPAGAGRPRHRLLHAARDARRAVRGCRHCWLRRARLRGRHLQRRRDQGTGAQRPARGLRQRRDGRHVLGRPVRRVARLRRSRRDGRRAHDRLGPTFAPLLAGCAKAAAKWFLIAAMSWARCAARGRLAHARRVLEDGLFRARGAIGAPRRAVIRPAGPRPGHRRAPARRPDVDDRGRQLH